MTYWQWLRQFGGLRRTWIFYLFVLCRAGYSAIRGDLVGAVTFLAGGLVFLGIHLLVAWDIYRRARRYHESVDDAPLP